MNKQFTQAASSEQFKGVYDFFKKSSLYAVLLFVLGLGQTVFAQAPPAIPNTMYLGAYNSCHYYKVTTGDVTNAVAASTCYTYGGRLPKVTSSAHNSWLKGAVNGKCWLGLDNAHVTNTWCYHDVSTPSYTNWGSGVFSWITSWFGLSTVNYGCLDLDGYWRNCDSYTKAWCVIEVPYTPTPANNCVCAPPTVPNCTYLGIFEDCFYYKSNKGDLDSYQANALCGEYGGRLPRIKSSTHNSWLKGACGEGFWLGHHKLTGSWKYQDGLTSLGFSNWNWNIGSELHAKCELDGSWKSCSNWAKSKCVIEIPCKATVQPLLDQYISVDNGTFNKVNTVTVCSGQTVKLDLAGAYPTTWKFVYTRPDGVTFPGGTGGVDNDQIQFQVATSGANLVNKGTWKVTYTNPNGCTNTASYVINANATTVAINNTPQNINVTAIGTCAVANWTAPTAVSNCGAPVLTSNFASGFCFPIGTTTVTYTATLNGVTVTSSFTVTVAAPVVAPAAVNDNANTAQNAPVTINVLGNDNLNGGLNPVLMIVAQSPNGTASIVNGQIVFTPNAGFSGTATFTYKVTASNGTSNTATVSVNVAAPVVAPVAVNDNANTAQNTPVTIPVLNNDNLNGGLNPVLMIVAQSPNGTATIVNGQIVFTPNQGFSGTATFTYKVTASNGTSNTATVSVVVPAPAPAPIANNDNATTPQNTPVTITPLSNDVVNGVLQSITILSQPANGTVVLNGSNFVFTPNQGFSGTTTFTYAFTTTNGTSNTATVTVVVPAPVVAPVAVNDNSTTPQNTPVTIPVLNNDNLNGGVNPVISIVSQSPNGTASVVNGQVVFTPNQGFSGTTTFTYAVTASNGTSNTATVTVVVPTPAALPIANNDNATTPQNTPVTISPLSNDVVNGTLQSVAIKTQPANGTVLLNGSNFVFTPNAGFVGTTTFTYCFTTSNGTSNTATVTVVVPAPVVAPVAVNDNSTTPQNTPVTIPVLNNDNLNGGVNPVIAIVSQSPNGTASVVNGQVVFTPNQGFSGTTTFTYSVTASNGTSNVATVTVVVPAPVNNNDLCANPTANIVGGAGTITITGVTTSAAVIQIFNSAWTSVYNQQISTSSVTVPNLPAGTYNVKVTVLGAGGSWPAVCDKQLTVTVTGGNNPVAPVAVNDNSTTPQNTPVTINVLGNDNLNGGANPVIAIVSQSPNGTASVVNGQVVFTPNQGFSGTTTFTYSITASNGTSNVATVTVVVPAPTSGDVCTSPASSIVGGAGVVTITGITTSAAVIQVFNETFTANISTTQVSTPTATITLPAGNYNVKVTVLGQGGTFPSVCEVSKAVTVTNGGGGNPTAPVAVNDNSTTPQNTPVTIPVLGNDNLNGGANPVISIVSQSPNGTASVVNGQVVFTPNQGFSGTTTFTYSITASNGTSNVATVTVVVPAPVLNCNETRNNAISKSCANGAPVLVGTVLAGYEYQWLSSTSVCPNGPSQAIAGATNANLVLPSVVAQNTYFMRCARPIGCTLWDAITESNCLTVTPTDCAAVVLVGCDAVNVIGSSTGTIGVSGMGNYTSQILVFNSQWQPISNQQYNVPATSIAVKNGDYIVKVQLYSTVGGWQFVCEKQFTVNVSGGLALVGNTQPVLELSAKAELRHVQLGWANNTGNKTDYFTVEKLSNLSGNFEPLTWVNATHSDKMEYYTVKDEQPTEGDNTYRVNVTTYDGTKKVSNVSTIKYSNVYDFRTFPNPANSSVSVDLTNYKNQATEVYLYNYLGQVSQVIKSENVTNTIVEFDVTKEPVGQYSIRVASKGKRDVIKPLVITH
jgi:Bacterial Ig domain/Secretion system C-terminal sorting domain